jgi:hypothetical protein
MFGQASQLTLEKRRQAWLKISGRGKARFVLIRGVLGWGMTTFVLIGLYRVFVNHDRSYLNPISLFIGLIAWSIGGALWGLAMWRTGQNFLRSGKGIYSL